MQLRAYLRFENSTATDCAPEPLVPCSAVSLGRTKRDNNGPSLIESQAEAVNVEETPLVRD